MAAGEGQSGQGPALLGMLADQFWRAADRRLRQVIEGEVTRITAPVIRGGRLVASTLSGLIPLSSLPAHKTTHQSGGSDALTGSLDATARLQIATDGTLRGTRRQLNLIAGSNITLTGADNAAAERVDVTIAMASGAAGDNTLTGSYASRPAPSNDGDLFFPSDGYTVQRSTGTSWVPWGPLYPFTEPPPLSSWTWVNQGTATAEHHGGVLHLMSDYGQGYAWRVLVQTAPTPPYTVTAIYRVLFVDPADNVDPTVGLLWHEAGTSNFHISTLSANNTGLTSTKWTLTSFVAHYRFMRAQYWLWSGLLFHRLVDDGTSRKIYYSADGQHWALLHSVARTDFLIPNRVGIGVTHGVNAPNQAIMHLLSWQVS